MTDKQKDQETGGLDIAGAGEVTKREDAGLVVHIRRPDGEPAHFLDGDKRKPVTIRIAGSYSATYRRALDTQKERMLRRRATSISAADMGRNQVDLVASCVLEWEGIAEGGKIIPLTKDNAVRLLSVAPWILRQLEDAQEDHVGFFPTPSPT